jgi:hypothetical protein
VPLPLGNSIDGIDGSFPHRLDAMRVTRADAEESRHDGVWTMGGGS